MSAPTPIEAAVRRWPEEWQYEFDNRAGKDLSDGRAPKLADQAAWFEIRKQARAQGVSL